MSSICKCTHSEEAHPTGKTYDDYCRACNCKGYATQNNFSHLVNTTLGVITLFLTLIVNDAVIKFLVGSVGLTGWVLSLVGLAVICVLGCGPGYLSVKFISKSFKSYRRPTGFVQ